MPAPASFGSGGATGGAEAGGHSTGFSGDFGASCLGILGYRGLGFKGLEFGDLRV